MSTPKRFTMTNLRLDLAAMTVQRNQLLAALRTAHYYMHDAKNLPEAGAGLAETLRAIDTAIATVQP